MSKQDDLFKEPDRKAMALDAHRVLVLNADYRPFSYYPLSTANWQHVMFLHVKGMTTGIKRFTIVEQYDDVFVHCGNNKMGEQSQIRLPSVIAHLQYLKPPKKIPMTKQNVSLRDNYTCQYSGKKCTEKELSWDHVIPRAAGGGTSWENIVSSAQKINELKDDMSVKQFEKLHGYKLLAQPRTPTWGELYEKGKQYPPDYIHPSWTDYLNWDSNG